MSQTTIAAFAKQIKISIDKLLDQLEQAGITGKSKNDILEDDEKLKLLQYLKGDSGKQPAKERVSVKRKTTDEIKQTTRTGAARTVHVEVKKRRTFVKRSVLEAEQAEIVAKEAAEVERLKQEEEARLAKEEEARLAKEAEEQAKIEAEEKRIADEQAKEREKEESERLTKEAEKEARQTQEVTEKSATAEVTPVATSVKDKPAPEKSVSDKKQPEKPKKGKKGKRGNETANREELHAAKRRKDKRRQPIRKSGNISSSIADQHAFEKPTAPVVHEIQVPITITVGEIAQAMSIKAGEVIKTMMDMGSMVTINQILDQDTAILLIEEMGHIAKVADEEDPEAILTDSEQDSEQLPRPPVVTVMGACGSW